MMCFSASKIQDHGRWQQAGNPGVVFSYNYKQKFLFNRQNGSFRFSKVVVVSTIWVIIIGYYEYFLLNFIHFVIVESETHNYVI